MKPRTRISCKNSKYKISFLALLALAFSNLSLANNDAMSIRVLKDTLDIKFTSYAEHLAGEMLSRQGVDRIENWSKVLEMSAELERILQLIKIQEPKISDFTFYPPCLPGVVIFSPEPGLSSELKSQINENVELISLKTSDPYFNRINQRFGLHAIYYFDYFDSYMLYYDARADSSEIATLHQVNGSARIAEPDCRVSDGPFMKANKDQNAWFVFVSLAWGDCMAGCIYRDRMFFEISGNKVKSIPLEEVRKYRAFDEIVPTLLFF